MPPAAPLGQFLELAIPTHDIAASVRFYERLGFAQRLTGDAWPHPYGVLGDERIHLGLHEHAPRGQGQGQGYGQTHATEGVYGAAALLQAPTPCFVHPGLVRHAERLQQAGLVPERLQFGEETLHHLWLRDPGGQTVLMQEARTFSPATAGAGAGAGEQSLCGYFLQLSLPEADFEAALAFWERAGFVGLPEEDMPYPHQPLTSDQLDLAFHAPRICEAALLVFEAADAAMTLERLLERGVRPLSRPPRALQGPGSVVLEAPEGTLLLLVPPRSSA